MTNVFPSFEPDQPPKSKRRLRLRGRKIPVRMLVPNIFTLLGLCAGLTAIRMAIEGRYELAILAIVLAAVFDGIDGRVARLLKATSRFGAELDSLADFVNFGVAPAVIIFTWALQDMKNIGWIGVMIFALCAALRLARFNVSLDVEQPAWKGNYFVGVPVPAGAIVLLLPLYLEKVGVPPISFLKPAILFYTLFIAFLMVSNIPTFSGKRAGRRISRQYVLPLFVLAVSGVAFLVTYPFLTLVTIAMGYLLFLPVGFISYRKMEKLYSSMPATDQENPEQVNTEPEGTEVEPETPEKDQDRQN